MPEGHCENLSEASIALRLKPVRRCALILAFLLMPKWQVPNRDWPEGGGRNMVTTGLGRHKCLYQRLYLDL